MASGCPSHLPSLFLLCLEMVWCSLFPLALPTAASSRISADVLMQQAPSPLLQKSLGCNRSSTPPSSTTHSGFLPSSGAFQQSECACLADWSRPSSSNDPGLAQKEISVSSGCCGLQHWGRWFWKRRPTLQWWAWNETCRPRSCGLSKIDPFLTLWGSHTSAADGLGVPSTSLETFTELQKMHLSLDHLTYQARAAEVDLKLSRAWDLQEMCPTESHNNGDMKK